MTRRVLPKLLPRHGTVVAYLALLIALSGSASAVTYQVARTATPTGVSLNPASGHYNQGAPCPRTVRTIASKTVRVARAGFYDAHTTETASISLQNVSQALPQAPLTVEWVVGHDVLGGASVAPQLAINGKYDYPPAADIQNTPVWLARGTYKFAAELLLQGDTNPPGDANSCDGDTYFYSNLHGRLAAAP